MTRKCGYISLVGRPNAGKSTLLNALVGDKIAGVSRKPQTTRNRILGVSILGDAQILMLDTPGVHHNRNKSLLNAAMNRVALNTAAEGDVIVYLIDMGRGLTDEDEQFIHGILSNSPAKFIIAMTKIDAHKFHDVVAARNKLDLAMAQFFARPENEPLIERMLLDEILEVSAKRPESVLELKTILAKALPEGPWLFPEDDLTDMPRFFIASELIREQIFRQLNQEVPYSTAVKVTEVTFKPDVVLIRAVIMLNSKSHKPIMLGKGGSRIKALGTASREALEKHFDKKVFLDLSVRVEEGWTSDERMINELAHLGELSPPELHT